MNIYEDLLDNTVVKVTDRNIVNGEKSSALRCSIALAMKEWIPRLTVVQVTYYYAYLTFDSIPEYRIPLPNKVTDFIRDFDSGKEVEPFEFKLNI